MMKFQGWAAVCECLRDMGKTQSTMLNDGQRSTLLALADRLTQNGCIIADEVGMGKTRIAVALARAVLQCGGRAAVTIPTGLGAQWLSELQAGGVEAAPILRSLDEFYSPWRAQKQEKSRTPWSQEKILLVSHTFANWRFGEKTGIWRWGLLPSLYAEWRKGTSQRYPRGFGKTQESLAKSDWMLDAARDIWAGLSVRQVEILTKQYEPLDWSTFRDEAGVYQSNSAIRKALEQSVGMGLGEFHLLIIDEAHKARGETSGLSRLLGTLFVIAQDARVVGMTATPVELVPEDWLDMLDRIHLGSNSRPDDNFKTIKKYIEDYRTSLHVVRERWRSSDHAIADFKTCAENFEAALSPYVLRRDKREDPAVMLFMEKNNKPAANYRSIRPLTIATESLSIPWKEAVCAAEALSHIVSLHEDSTLKRTRLTMGSGHGIAAFMDSVFQDMSNNEEALDGVSPIAESSSKQRERREWWKTRLMAPCATGEDVLFSYPTIQEAVKYIEKITGNKNKVLVFGKFTRPMRALTDLLNAREILRCLKTGKFWPQEILSEELRAAVNFELRQSEHNDWNMEKVETALAEQYEIRRNAMRTFQHQALDRIAAGLQIFKTATILENTLNHTLLTTAFDSLQRLIQGKNAESDLYPLLCRAMREILGHDEAWASKTDEEYTVAFSEVIQAMTVPDDWDKNSDGNLDSEEAEQGLWPVVHKRLQENYNSPQGEFARFMYGQTAHTTRRLLQAAFNRLESYPRVLVAQSLVGREGLNLHSACRHVFILHPEWNPGVVEQQVGRVDRVNSLWDKTIRSGSDDSCTIEVQGLIFENTYDEHNWQVLFQRWDDLRAQLHGEVIAPRQISDEDRQSYAERLAALAQYAPNFSPAQQIKTR